MIAVTDFGFGATLERVEHMLFLGLLAAMVFSGVCYARRRSEPWPRVFGWGALGALIIQAGLMAARAAEEGLRASTPSRETPDVPVSYETWEFIDSLVTLLLGLALLVSGLAFIYLGWMEGKNPKRDGTKKRARA